MRKRIDLAAAVRRSPNNLAVAQAALSLLKNGSVRSRGNYSVSISSGEEKAQNRSAIDCKLPNSFWERFKEIEFPEMWKPDDPEDWENCKWDGQFGYGCDWQSGEFYRVEERRYDSMEIKWSGITISEAGWERVAAAANGQETVPVGRPKGLSNQRDNKILVEAKALIASNPKMSNYSAVMQCLPKKNRSKDDLRFDRIYKALNRRQ
ncbi:hypothetical protein ACFOWX_00420 [Sphingorhabdus arenilitoris]|uniref:Uncharacterized protein n=1 Tax=Sphingorhabdus arenilitoris TaxID=1490041 RepID=A0ABV8RD97_9SPHN